LLVGERKWFGCDLKPATAKVPKETMNDRAARVGRPRNLVADAEYRIRASAFCSRRYPNLRRIQGLINERPRQSSVVNRVEIDE